MKRVYQLIIAAAIVLVTATFASAQTLETVPTYNDGNGSESKMRINLLYNYSLPTGSFKNDFIKNNSPRGFNLDLLYWFKPEWGAGAAFGFQDYYQKNARATYKLNDGSDISAVVSHSVQVIPVMAKAMFSPNAESRVQPYLLAAAGINLVRFNEYLGEFSSLNNSSVNFGAEAGAGVKIPFGTTKRAGFMLGASYRYSPYNKYEVKNLNSFNLQAGFQFRLSK
jgi:opacity protein-like surface antigen